MKGEVIVFIRLAFACIIMLSLMACNKATLSKSDLKVTVVEKTQLAGFAHTTEVTVSWTEGGSSQALMGIKVGKIPKESNLAEVKYEGYLSCFPAAPAERFCQNAPEVRHSFRAILLEAEARGIVKKHSRA